MLFALAFLAATGSLDIKFTPNAVECLEVYNHCFRSGGHDCAEQRDQCNAKAYGSEKPWLDEKDVGGATKAENKAPANSGGSQAADYH